MKTGLKPVLPPVKKPQNARALATKTASQNALSQAKKIVSTRERSAEVNKKPMPRVETQHNLTLDSSTQVKEQGSSRSEKSTNAQRLAVNDVSGQQKNLPKSQPVSPQIVTAEKIEKQRLEKEQEQLRKQKETQALALKKQQEDARKKEEALKAKLALEAKKKEEERLKKLEADRVEKARLEAERLKKLEAERLEKDRLEAIRLQAIDRAEDRRLIAQFSQEIVEKLRPHYHLPPGLEGHITTVLEVSLNSTGDVQQVQLKKSSGNDTHDRAAIAAIMKASPLPMPGKKSARDRFLVFDLTVSPKSMLQTDP